MFESYHQILKRNRYKVTPQRKAILEVLDNTRGMHFTAEEIYNQVKKTNPQIGIATVYRTLELLVRLEIVYKSSFDEGRHRYEFYEGDRHFHHHFLCNKCGVIIEVEEDYLCQLEGVLEERGFMISNHNLRLYGLCPACHRKEKHPETR
ncbi:MAG: transcriptional repressor [Syntrophomonadaceae bacterium]|nr:transcriptional repressor [Syntrophomonadaceae bacterium]